MWHSETDCWSNRNCVYSPGNDSKALDWFHIADVDANNNDSFQYLPGESDDTVWPSKYTDTNWMYAHYKVKLFNLWVINLVCTSVIIINTSMLYLTGHINYYFNSANCCFLLSIGGIPYDGVLEEQDVSISVGLTVVFSLLGTVSIFFSLACLAFNFHFRNKMWDRFT